MEDIDLLRVAGVLILAVLLYRFGRSVLSFVIGVGILYVLYRTWVIIF